MKLWLCRWPNGEVSIVRAENADEALEILDEQGEATADMLSELDPGKRFLLTFQPVSPVGLLPAEEPLESVWRSASLGEDMDEALGDPTRARALFESEQTALRRERFAALGTPCPTCGTRFPKTD